MANQITANFRPIRVIYTHGWSPNEKCYDGDFETYGAAGQGIPSTAVLLLDLSSIPSGSVIKKVAYRYTLYRIDNASFCGLKGAMGYSDAGLSSSGEHQVTAWQEIPLTAYKTKETTNTEQAITASESAQILSTPYSTLYVDIYNSHRVYEISVDITYEPDDGSKTYTGTNKAAEIYGGAKQGEMYIGTTKVL